MPGPYPKLIMALHAEIRRRHENQRRLESHEMDRNLNEYIRTSSLLDRRLGWRADGCPRFLYKYRPPPVGAHRKWLEDILLRHQLWMADSSKYEDAEDSKVTYKVTLRGDALQEKV